MKVCMAKAVDRFEVIDETGRAYVRSGVSIELSYQDEGRTLKAFLTPQEREPDARGWWKRIMAKRETRS